jgi:hypothetical protein
MVIETLGASLNFSWELYLRCLDHGREGTKHKRT